MSFDKRASYDLATAAGLALDRFPETKQEGDLAAEVLAEELDKLSLDEHEKVLFDIHGISEAPEETEELLQRKLRELEEELTLIKEKAAYEQAKEHDPTYVCGSRLRLMFLRSELLDAVAAAKKLVFHFEMKRKLFGDGEILGRDVCQADLSAKEQHILKAGFVQILPSRDASGRCIVSICTSWVESFQDKEWDQEEEVSRQSCSVLDQKDTVASAFKSQFRSVWYLTMASLRDEETQRKGCVLIVFNYNSHKNPMSYFLGSFELETAIPRRLVGGHLCYKDESLRPYISGFQMFVSEHDRLRVREHCESHDNIIFQLQTYGIPTEQLPVNADGSLSCETHLESIEALRNEEKHNELKTPGSMCASTSGKGLAIIVPRNFDVLFGKHVLARQHTGTLRALHLVEMHYQAYEAAGKYKKTEVADGILSIVHESGGRFLKQDKHHTWHEVQDLEARQKVAHWFRHSRHKKSQNTSGTNDANVAESNNICNKRATTLNPIPRSSRVCL